MTTKQNGEFDALLKAITDVGDDADTMTKSAPTVAGKDDTATDDQTIDAASTASDDKDKDKDKDGKPDFAKSLTVTGADGEPVEAIDATEIIKSLQDRVGEHDTVLAKALTGMATAMQKQSALIKSLQENMTKLASQGTGRKAMFMAVDKPAVGAADTMAKGGAADGQMSADEFFAKAETAFAERKITGAELNTIDVCRRMNAPIDQGLIRKVALS